MKTVNAVGMYIFSFQMRTLTLKLLKMHGHAANYFALNHLNVVSVEMVILVATFMDDWEYCQL